MKNNRYQNRTIRLIKYFLIIIAALASFTMLYFTIMNKNNKVSKSQQNINNEDNSTFKINTAKIVGINFDHGPYYIESNDMEETSGYINFISPKIKMMLKHLDWFNLTSLSAKLKTTNNHLELNNDIKANLNNQYFVTTEELEIIPLESLIKSNLYTKIYTETSSIESNTGFIANYESQKAFFSGKINANIRNSDQSITNIKSDKFNVFWNDRKAYFIGNAILLNQGTTVKANKMTALLNKKTNELEKIFLYENIRIINKEQTSTSEYGEYDINSSILTLSNNVQLHKQGNIMNGEVLHYNFKTKNANLIGQKNKTNNKRVKAIIIPNSKALQK